MYSSNMEASHRVARTGVGEPDEMVALLRAALELCPPRSLPVVEELVAARAFTDAAIAILRTALPDCGFKLVIPPSRAGMCEAFASLWRRGASRAVAYRGTTPAMAILDATKSEWAKVLSANALADCARCRGVGWYVNAVGVKLACRHVNM